jgi:hypothetical protein
MQCPQFAVLVTGKQAPLTAAGGMSAAIFPGRRKAPVDGDENIEKAII